MSRGRVVWALVASVLLVGALFLFVLPGRTYLSQRQSLNAAQVRIRVLSAQNAKLAQETAKLQTDAEIERLARQQYGLVKPGEQAYAILPASQPNASHPGATAAPAAKPRHHPWWAFWR